MQRFVVMGGLLAGAWALATTPTTVSRAQQPPALGADRAEARGERAEARGEVLEFQFLPVRSAQIAVWLEAEDGTFLRTVALTEATARRGIGNRPGASQMNSGFRWPYGRREGVLPTWAYRRANAPGAAQFRRVIFQDRRAEGLASRTSNDYSRDDYFCLSFDRSRADRDALDAVSCASVFNSDKGRFMTDEDVAEGYAEPYEDITQGPGVPLPLSYHSAYPPRMDVGSCPGSCFDHADVPTYADHARAVMPEIDTVSMATPAGEAVESLLFTVPPDWAPGQYQACIEINVEGDYNDTYNDRTYPTPVSPFDMWDSWATDYGYPYRGQPSVVYCTDIALGSGGSVGSSTAEPSGSVATWDTTGEDFGKLVGMEGMTDDPELAPGQGADRLRRMEDGSRFRVTTRPPASCESDAAPTGISGLRLRPHPELLHAHEWAEMTFAAADDDQGVFRYDARISSAPIEDETAFQRAEPAKAATLEAEAVSIPTEVAAGGEVSVEIGGLVENTRHWVGVRAFDSCDQAGPITVVEFQTPERQFTTVTPCFIATAAYGSPLAADIGALRRFRDKHLQSHALGRAAVRAYYAVGPDLAASVAASETLRDLVRTALRPVVWLTETLDD